MGIQKSGPVAFPAARAESMKPAIVRALGLRVMMALMRELKLSIRVRKEETTSRQVVRPW